METKTILVRLPAALKRKLDALRGEGVTANGLIRHLLENHFTSLAKGQKGR